MCCDGEFHEDSGRAVSVCWRLDLRLGFRAGSCVGCCACLSVRRAFGDWGCHCVMSVHTSRGSCSSWASRTGGTVGPSEEGGAGDSLRCCSVALPGVTENKRERRFWTGPGGRTEMVEEAWVWEDKEERRHSVTGRRRTLQGTRLDIALQTKV